MKAIFDKSTGQNKREYVLLGLLEEECTPAQWATYEPVPISGWACLPGHSVFVPNLGRQATVREWTSWARLHNRQLSAGMLEWILMDPVRGQEFIKNIAKHTDFRRAYSSYYTSTAATLVCLGAPGPKAPLSSLTCSRRSSWPSNKRRSGWLPVNWRWKLGNGELRTSATPWTRGVMLTGTGWSGSRARSQLFPLGLLHAEQGRSHMQLAPVYLT